MRHLSITALVLLLFSLNSFASKTPIFLKKNPLLKKYSKTYAAKKNLLALKKETLNLGGKAVPTLIEVMKSGEYPDKNRWLATFLLGRIMGKKSAPFIVKFLKHPSWIMRMASLKTLLSLGQKKYAEQYASSLKDDSYIVRVQALENITKLKLTNYAANVWAMLYDKKNYYRGGKNSKRTNIIKRVVKTVGDLKFEKAMTPLLNMAQKDKYKDIFEEIDYSLSNISGKPSPKSPNHIKQRYWKKFALSKKTF